MTFPVNNLGNYVIFAGKIAPLKYLTHWNLQTLFPRFLQLTILTNAVDQKYHVNFLVLVPLNLVESLQRSYIFSQTTLTHIWRSVWSDTVSSILGNFYWRSRSMTVFKFGTRFCQRRISSVLLLSKIIDTKLGKIRYITGLFFWSLNFYILW